MRKFKYLAKLIIPSTCILVLLSLVIGGAFGILQMQTNSVENTFNLVYMDITVIEPGWDASLTDEHGRRIYASGETFVKDPLVSNIGSRDVYAYISVFVPDNPNTKDLDEIFSYNYNSDEWTFLNKELVYDSKGKYTGTTSYYAYNTVLKAGENTTPVFETMTFAKYNIDEENVLEDKQSAGEGDGSLILGKNFDVIVNGYAVTTDVDSAMREDMYYELMGVNAFYNGGVGTAWNYLTKEVIDNLEEEEAAPSYTSVVSEKNTFAVDFCDEDGNVLHSATIYACDGDILNVDYVNDYMKSKIECAAFGNTEDLYSHIFDENGEAIFSKPKPLNIIANENNSGSFKIITNTKYAYVYISLIAEGETQQVIPLQFEKGEVISNETISTKLSEFIGQTITIPSPEINEIAVVGDTYNLSIDISSLLNQ